MSVEPIDLSDSNSSKEAAEKSYEQIRRIADEMGQDPDIEVHMRETEEEWIISWGGGPFDWAVKLTGGHGIVSARPEITGFGMHNDYIAEVKNGSELVFTKIED